jgi:hypothetical protein
MCKDVSFLPFVFSALDLSEHYSRMLSGKLANDRQFEEFLLVRLIHEERPDAKASQAENEHYRQGNQAKDSGRQWSQDRRENHPDEPKSHPSNIKKNRLERMEPNEGVRFVGIKHEKNDRRNEAREIGKGPYEVGLHCFLLKVRWSGYGNNGT